MAGTIFDIRKPHGLTRDVLQTMAANLLMAVLSMFTGTLLARLLGPSLRGELAAIQVFPSTVAGLAALGIPQALVYWISRERDTAKQTLTTALLFLAPVAAIGFVLGYWLIPLVLVAQSDQTIQDARIFLFVIVHNLYGGTIAWVFQGIQQFKVWNFLRILPNVCWLMAITTGFALDALTPAYLVHFYIISAALPIPMCLWLAWKKLSGSWHPTSDRLRDLLAHGLPVALSSLPQMLNLRLDQLIMAIFFGSHLLGLYAVAVNWSNAMSPVLSAIGAVLFPQVANLHSSSERNKVVSTGMRISVFLTIAFMVPMIITTPIILPLLFGSAFASSVSAAVILVLAGAIASLNSVWEDLIRGLGHSKSLVFAQGIGLIVTIVVLAMLLRPFQLMGAAVASLASYGVTLIYLTVVIKRSIGLSIRQLLIPTSADFVLVWNRVSRPSPLSPSR